MQHFQGQYFGAALHSFVRGLSHSESVIRRILQAHELTRIAEGQWYDLNAARSIYYTVGCEIGERSLFTVGLEMIDAAPFPPGITDVQGVLTSLDHAYHMNVRRCGSRPASRLVTTVRCPITTRFNLNHNETQLQAR